MPIFRLTSLTSLGESEVRSWPSTITLPEVGLSSKFTQRISELFPAPLKPMTPKISPLSIARSIPLSAATCCPPLSYTFLRS
ncbi:Uncharacterised protein [Mycobacteroides abscessus subsp. abscessus]|nr:Uncharacterised protein [Mycobacteroides abscessus subsp. abscessus]